MTGPENLSIGGVSFYKRDVKSYEVKNQGSNFYTVFMKDGTKVSFRDQDPNNKASIMMGVDCATSKKGIQFSNVHLHSLEGTDNKDYYYLSHSDVSVINLENDNGNADELKFVYNDETRRNITSPSYVDKDANDKIKDVNLSNEKFINMHEGLFYRPKE